MSWNHRSHTIRCTGRLLTLRENLTRLHVMMVGIFQSIERAQDHVDASVRLNMGRSHNIIRSKAAYLLNPKVSPVSQVKEIYG